MQNYFHREREYEQEPHTAPARLAQVFDLQGPNYNCLTACAASSQAIGEATEIIRHGDADVMLSGGAHSMIHPLGMTGFNLLPMPKAETIRDHVFLRVPLPLP